MKLTSFMPPVNIDGARFGPPSLMDGNAAVDMSNGSLDGRGASPTGVGGWLRWSHPEKYLQTSC
jgi:hypothetical protein